MEVFDAISLFSGALGLDVGLEQVGRLVNNSFGPTEARFKIRACVESDPSSQQSILKNLAEGNLEDKNLKLYGDITRIKDPKSILEETGIKGSLPLLVGGPPCQSFSTAGRRGTGQDPRGSLIWEFVRFVREMNPRFFLMENVRGLLSAAIRHRPIAKRGPDSPPLEDEEQPGSVYRMLLNDFESLGYHVDVFEVNAVNYGAPQLRERVLFIGNRYNLSVEFPQPTHGDPSLIGGTLTPMLPYRTLRDAVQGLVEKEPVLLDFSPRKKRYLARVPPGGNWRSMPTDVQRESMGEAWFAKGGRSGWWRKLSWDLPSPCLVTMPNHASTSLCHPDELRVLSLREYTKIQEFPDNWIVTGTVAEQYRQVGNAVPVRLGEVAGKVIGDALIGLGERKDLRPGEKVKPSRRVYVKSHVRTRKWYYNGQPVARPTQNQTLITAR